MNHTKGVSVVGEAMDGDLNGGSYLGLFSLGLLLASATDFGQVGNDLLGVLSLTSTRLSAVGETRYLEWNIVKEELGQQRQQL